MVLSVPIAAEWTKNDIGLHHQLRHQSPHGSGGITLPDDDVILDHLDSIVVSRDVHHNSLNVLRSLDIGMFHLATFTRQREVAALEIHGAGKVVHLFQITDETLLLGCVFDWFSISLVNYLRLVKLMHVMERNDWGIGKLQDKQVQKELKGACLTYVRDVAPEVYQWRNKIAAHRAAVDPQDDNLTTLTFSTMPAVAYQSPFYGVGYLKLFMGGGGELDIDAWALTEKYESLAPRYWPDRRLPKLDW